MSSMSSSSSSDSESSSSVASRAQKRKRAPSVSSDSSSSSSSDSEAEQSSAEDVPVLSHAEQRRQRRKEQKTQAKAEGGEDADDGDRKAKKLKVKNTAELAPSKVPKRQNSVWVGNLAFKTTPDALRRFFDGVGEVTRVHMPMKMASTKGAGAVKENRGFAYVDFATPDAKTLAITLSENNLDGRKLLIKDGGDFTGRPEASKADSADGTPQSNLSGHSKTAQKILRSQKQPAAPTLFMGNLGFQATEDSIRDLFTRNRMKSKTKPESDEEKEANEGDGDEAKEGGKGKEKEKDKWIKKIRMGTFEDTGKCKGWAFVDFTSLEHATAALTNPKNYFLDGRKLVIEYASPEAVRRGQGGRRPGFNRDGTAHSTGEHAATENEKAPQHEKRTRVRPKRDAPPRPETDEPPAKRTKSDDATSERRPRERTDSKVRAKPGAALASARREQVGIVPSQGKKIVF